jgi:hypothetical protein
MRVKYYGSLLACCFIISIFSSSANAITITFDELDPATIENERLTNEYESQGLVFDYNAYLVSASTQSAPNYVIGPGISLHFTNELPTYVSFYTGSSTEHKVFISAFGPNGYFSNLTTEGGLNGWGSDESTPYIPNQFVVFQSEFGIASIELSGQSDGYIDDLTFYVAGDETSVPEPSVIILLILGLGCIASRKLKLH